ncbi:MAG: hypothetical protein ACREJG_10595 [Candidatus Rokuibacteriota bacterium]
MIPARDARLREDLRVLRDVGVEIDPDDVLRFQGYKRGADVPDRAVLALFDEALDLGRRLGTPRATLRWLRVTGRRGDVLELPEATLVIPGVERDWGVVAWVAVAVCTIGDALEREVARLWEARELPLAVMLDSVGSAAVESLAEHVNDALCGEGVAAGLHVTNRISPGYGAWDVRDQRVVFRLGGGEAVGVALNEACFMTPEKSITLVAGAGVAARVDHYFSQCARCWMADCAYRRVPPRRTLRREGLR